SEQLLGVSPDGRLVEWRGTSGAAPIVAGIAALVRAAHPGLDAGNVINRIESTARLPAGQSPVLYGSGLVDAARAVAASVPTVSANPADELREWIRVYRRATPSEPTDQPTVAPVDVPQLPPADAVSEAASPLLPSADTLRYGTVPLLVLTVPAILIGLGVTAAVRRIRSARSARVTSR